MREGYGVPWGGTPALTGGTLPPSLSLSFPFSLSHSLSLLHVVTEPFHDGKRATPLECHLGPCCLFALLRRLHHALSAHISHAVLPCPKPRAVAFVGDQQASVNIFSDRHCAKSCKTGFLYKDLSKMGDIA